MSKRRRVIIAAIALVAVAGGLTWYSARFPPDTTPEGAYLRIAAAIASDDPAGCFSYLEEDAQHAAFSIHDYSHKSASRIEAAYPPPARERALASYRPLADAGGGDGVWALLARDRGWIGRLRRDLSGIDNVETHQGRATITTARGTRYSFRKRPNGMWGLTLFTVELQAEAERLARDWEQIDRAAADYERESNAPQ